MSVQPHLDKGVDRLHTFWFKPTASFWSEALNIIWLVLRNDVYQTFTLVDHTIKSRPSTERCYLPLTFTHAWVYSFRKGYFVRAASHKEITRNARTLRLLQTELQVQSMN